MKRLIVAAVAVIASSPVAAGGLAEVIEPDVVVPAAPNVAATDWSGFYAGLQYDTIIGGDFVDTTDSSGSEVEGNFAGGFVGYRRSFDSFVLGAELDYVTGSGSVETSEGATVDLDYDSLLRAGVEGGYSFGRALIYGTAGYASLDLTNTGGSGDSFESNGYYYGIGADYQLTDQIIIGAEILQHQFEDFEDAFEPVELDVLTAGISAAYRF